LGVGTSIIRRRVGAPDAALVLAEGLQTVAPDCRVVVAGILVADFGVG
jgi:hypothetical protein